MEKEKELLRLLSQNARYSVEELAAMLDLTPQEVSSLIEDLERRRVILGYRALIDWRKVGEEKVTAFIEVKVTPQREVGFDAVAKRIARFPEVKNIRLVSGTYDLAVEVEGRRLEEVASFVATRLAPMEGVVSTTTHFMLKPYKIDGELVEDVEEVQRLVVSP
ncbi:transcriptional regulator, AsnC family [Ammonifex degensii KC4]|uniref:Transcriptional regulator, AsnC family n=1 Tax=Ammonifex degensii (strain DSM 10501 / KC4) TaxID=429009 RepID=C9RAB4_AMMDK|nr:Lrp/AsnC family transcriptional regulator [Ammonifex degensii]ACX51223.1 transcriptional regulator, AsnC family [Ammonifex degensii KC4]